MTKGINTATLLAALMFITIFSTSARAETRDMSFEVFFSEIGSGIPDDNSPGSGLTNVKLNGEPLVVPLNVCGIAWRNVVAWGWYKGDSVMDIPYNGYIPKDIELNDLISFAGGITCNNNPMLFNTPAFNGGSDSLLPPNGATKLVVQVYDTNDVTFLNQFYEVAERYEGIEDEEWPELCHLYPDLCSEENTDDREDFRWELEHCDFYQNYTMCERQGTFPQDPGQGPQDPVTTAPIYSTDLTTTRRCTHGCGYPDTTRDLPLELRKIEGPKKRLLTPFGLKR